MIFIAKANGDIEQVFPEPVHQGSVGVNEIILVAPFVAGTVVTAACKLPNGIYTKPTLLRTATIPSLATEYGESYNAWEFTLDAAVTQYPGAVTVQFFVHGNGTGTTLATYTGTFTVTKGVMPELPDTPSQSVYDQILSALAGVSKDLATAERTIASHTEIIANNKTAIESNTAYISQLQAMRIEETELESGDKEYSLVFYDKNAGGVASHGATFTIPLGRVSTLETDVSAIKTELGKDDSEKSIKGRIKSVETKLATYGLFDDVSITYDEYGEIKGIKLTFLENGAKKEVPINLEELIGTEELRTILEGLGTYIDESISALNIQGGAKNDVSQKWDESKGNTFEFSSETAGTKTIPQYAILGNFAAAFGGYSAATGKRSFACGSTTLAEGAYSHTEGVDTYAAEAAGHAEGRQSSAIGYVAHAEGDRTVAIGSTSHSEGYKTEATGNSSHSQGEETSASGFCSHASGKSTVASGDYSSANGLGTVADGYGQTSVGTYNTRNSNALFVVGRGEWDDARVDAFSINNDGSMTFGGVKVTPEQFAQAMSGGGTSYKLVSKYGEWHIDALTLYVDRYAIGSQYAPIGEPSASIEGLVEFLTADTAMWSFTTSFNNPTGSFVIPNYTIAKKAVYGGTIIDEIVQGNIVVKVDSYFSDSYGQTRFRGTVYYVEEA